MKKIIIMLISISLLTGCYNYKELQELGIASSILIDYRDNQYEVTVEVLEKNTSKLSKGQGQTIDSALSNALLGSKKELYYTHLNALILTQNVDIENILNYFIRDPDINSIFYLIITESTDIYQENDLGKTLSDILLRNQTNNFFEITKIIYDERQDLILPYLDQNMMLDKAIAYHGFKATYILNEEEVNTYKILNNKSKAYFITACDKGSFDVAINSLDTKYTITDKINITIDMEATIKEYNCSYDTTDAENIKKIETLLNQNIYDKTTALLKQLTLLESDILGINRRIYAKKHNLDQNFTDYEYNIKINTHINKKGLLLK